MINITDNRERLRHTRIRMKDILKKLVGAPAWAYGAVIGGLAVLAAAGSLGVRTLREPNSPPQLSLKDWKQALLETKTALTNKNLSMYAAGISYFSSLAFFPLVAAAVAIALLLITPEQIQAIAHTLEQYLPGDMAKLLTSQLSSQAAENKGNLLVAIIAIAISLFSASGAVDRLTQGLNAAYSAEETRGFIKLKLMSILLTLSGIIIGFVMIGLIVLNSSILTNIGLPASVAMVILVLRWFVIVVLMSIVLSVLYRYAPNRLKARWQWVSWGAGIATIIWLIGTAAFFIYVQNFANFSQSYSVFAGIIILMMWLNLSALIVLIGAQVNHRLEARSSRQKIVAR